MKRITAIIVASIFAAPISAQTIATVNGQEISQGQIDNFIELLATQGATDSAELRDQVKQELIHRTVVVQEAEKNGIDKDSKIQQELELARQGILVRAAMNDYLEKNPITDKSIQDKYSEMKAAEGDKKEYKVRHILVEEESNAKNLIEKINKKEIAFDEAAKNDSIDTGSGSRGGELGWAQADNYVPEFAEAVRTMKKGTMGKDPVKSQFGWHIIEVMDERAVEFPELDEVKPQIEEMLRNEALSDYQTSLIEAADIKQD